MKRPPGLWLLLSAGVLWLSLQDVYGIRATALIFGKSTTTTTTEGPEKSLADENSTESSTEGSTSNVTKPTLTGNPQLDYIWDPNLPQELNGYNLSEYPFYERVPEVIDFKCDGLHDGFYASVLHKCQVYHHCLFGTRFDFLCANYTAFDQKTFICQFVSEVDCKNSKKFWHRNDALYQAASTTTVKPAYSLGLYTVPPQSQQPQQPAAVAAPSDAVAPLPPLAPRRPPGGRRRPYRRRRPQYEYYDYEEDYEDDYYAERARPEARRRKRPKPRPRPVYDDEYEEYEDEREDRRSSSRRDGDRPRKHNERRGSEDRRPVRRNKDKRKYENEYDEEYEDTKKDERRPQNRRPDDYESDEEDRRRNRPKNKRPVEEDDYEEVVEKAKPPAERAADKAISKPSSGGSLFDRPRAAPKIKPPVPKSEANKYAYKPSSSTKAPATAEDDYYADYEEEYVEPKSHRKQQAESTESRRYVPRREEERSTRKQMSRQRPRDDYEETSQSRPHKDRSEEKRPYNSEEEIKSSKRQEDVAPKRSHKDRSEESSTRRPHKEEATTRRAFKPKVKATRSSSKRPPVEDYYEDYEDSKEQDISKHKSYSSSRTTSTITSTITTTTTTTTTPRTTTTYSTTAKELPRESIVRIVKRPFLPSRGGNPYASRNLQPVGSKALDKRPEAIEQPSRNPEPENIETLDVKPMFKPSPVMIKVPITRSKSTTEEPTLEFKPVSNRPQTPPKPSLTPKDYTSGPRTTQKPKIADPDPLDIQENEYDVTLNDALNPTLPNLPVRSFPTGFSSANDYTYSSYQRPRFVAVEPAPSQPSGPEYVYQAKPVRQRYEVVQPQTYPNAQEQFVNTNADYKGQYSTINGQNYRPRLAQTFAYSNY